MANGTKAWLRFLVDWWKWIATAAAVAIAFFLGKRRGSQSETAPSVLPIDEHARQIEDEARRHSERILAQTSAQAAQAREAQVDSLGKETEACEDDLDQTNVYLGKVSERLRKL